MRRLLAASFVLAALVPSAPASACDELVGKLIANAVRPSIESLGCSELRRAGLNNAAHHLESVCYASSGAESVVSMVVSLTCKTSDKALIKASVSEKVSASARVRASDCQILDLKVEAAGDIGRILLAAFGAAGAARTALQAALDRVCSPQ